MGAEIGNEYLVVCFSEYLPIYVIRGLTVCIPKRSVSDHESPFFLGFKCRLGLPVVREVSGVVTMKYIDMYILHDSSLVLCFTNISAYFAYSEVMGKVKVVAGSFLSPRSHRGGSSCLGIGLEF